ncbi:GNAT family N-acetyltransferase [Prochlorococcus sp. MIT 1307]|uniref:GNAT family N-acetyltransferase n=1 Tax=Prochlorococcus sp. MIT 1307 TaxID=3096219 RepID=UPI002A74D283|nr:GNAT family N-acetyltransferase [Prochlorococcus sp. MIT 1307]
MLIKYELHPLRASEHEVVREVYSDAIESQGDRFYTKRQIQAWSGLAWLPGFLDRSLEEGRGWVSVEQQQLEAFAVRYPLNRLALLYCRGRSARRGHANALLDRLELEAREEGQTELLTEASFLSYPLLLRRGWKLISPEALEIGGVSFDRYRMKKKL